MADLIEIGVSVVDKGDGLKKAVSTVDRLEAKMTKLIKAQNLGTVSTDRFHKAMVIAGRELKKNSDLTGNQAYNAMQKYVAAKKRSIKAEQDSAKALAAEAVALKSNKAALDAQRTATKANTAALNSFRMQTDSVYKAEQKLLNLKKLLRAEVANNNMTMREAAAVQMQYKRSVDAMGGGLNQTARKTNQLGVMMQQTGYQVGDFAVQVGSGQNVMVAFGQQATQLVGTMAMFAKTTKMIALFSGLGIVIPILSAIGAGLLRARKESESFESSTFDINEAAKNATKELKDYREELALLASEYKTLGEVGLEKQIKQAQKELDDLLVSRQKILEQAKTSFGAEGATSGVEEAVTEALRDRTKEMNEQIFAKAQQLQQLVLERESLERVKQLTGETNSLLEDGKAATLERNRSNRQAVIDMQSELNLQQKIAEFGAESLEVVRHRAEQEAIAKNMTEASAEEYVKLAVESHKVQLQIDASVGSAKNLSDALNAAASAMARLTGFGDSLDVKIAQAAAKVKAIQTNANAANAAMAAGEKERARQYRDEAAAVAVGVDQLRQINAEYDTTISKIGELEGLENTFDSITEANKEAAAAANKSASASEKSAEALKKEIEALELAADATAKYKHEYDKLLKLQDAGLSEQAFAKEVAKLNEELANSSPVLQGFTDAFTNFLSTGANDFKTFANDIIGMFKNMLIKMIAMAAKNKIMLSMGMGGSALATSASAGNVAGVGSAAGTGAMGSFVGGFGAAGGAAGTGLLGGMGSVASGVMSGGLSGGASAIGTALSGATTGLAGFGAAIGAVALPLLAVTAVFSFFKKKTKELDSGLNVTVKNMDTFVESFSKVQTSRFWGLSKKTSTTTGAASDEVANPIIAAVSEIQNQVVKAADALGIASKAFDNFSHDFKLSLKGLTEEQAMAKINEELVKMGDSFASMTGLFSTMNELLAVAQQRYDLEAQLLNMEGDIVDLRKRELDTVHVLNKGLAARIQLLQAEADMSSALVAFASGISQQQGVIKSAVDALIAPLLEAINRTKAQAEASYKIFSTAADKTRSEAKELVDIITGAISSRNIQSEGLELMRYKQAQQQLSAFAGGASFDKESLSKATEGVSIDSQKFFGSFEDYARDFYKTQINLEKIEEKASEQLTDVEKQIEIADKAYQTAMGTYQESVDTNTALTTLLNDLAAYTEVAARNEPFIEQIKAEGDRQVELLDQILKETTLQVNALLGIDTSIADLVGTNISVGEALAVLGLSGAELYGAVLALDNPVAEIGSHIENLDLTLGGILDRLGLTFKDLTDLQVDAFGINISSFNDAVGSNINTFGTTVNGTIDGFGNSVNGTIDGFGNSVNGSIDGFGSSVNGTIDGFGNSVNGTIDGFGNSVNGSIDGFGTTVGGSITSLEELLNFGMSALGLTSEGLNLGLVGVDGTIGILASSVDAEAANILTLNGTVIAQNVVVDALTGEVSLLASNVVNLDGSVYGLGTSTDSLTTGVGNLGTNITDLGTATGNLGININDLGGTLFNAMSGLGSIVSGLSGAVSGLAASNNALAAAQTAAQAAAAASAAAAAEASTGTGAVAADAQKTITIVNTFGGGLGGASGVTLSDGRTFKTGKGIGNAAEIRNATNDARAAIEKEGNIAAFANGGMHSGGLRLVGENGPELEATGPSRIYSNQQTKGMMSGNGSSETVAELRMLRQEISEMKAEQRKIGVENVKYNKKSYDLNREWDIVGLPATRAS